ncbi:hypothetical protein BDK51DRAFT_27609 [Blyttiomyces helicus]|uniref:Protein argonaute N-terminal domain-containing protein n=1 Tax=Blyttiomyces helicus TaxID=388810 RepID=A0A4P9WAQ0_9FUNG|nr:hypothetical protein BDK51DRAFT_27609 [Blyttiomyces helicus]|eukprot:RKO88645.1 hypothetical protein BDK51DRAFT_27609 [Blyttiomyces helicus]
MSWQQDRLGPLFPAFASLSLAPPPQPPPSAPPPPRPPALLPPQTALQVSPFPRRPPLGTIGRPLQIRTNFFPILTLPGANIHHYDVCIVPEANPQTSRRLYALWEDMHSKSGGLLTATKPVFDGRRNLFSPRALGLVSDETTFGLELPNEDVEAFLARGRHSALIEDAEPTLKELKLAALYPTTNCTKWIETTRFTRTAIPNKTNVEYGTHLVRVNSYWEETVDKFFVPTFKLVGECLHLQPSEFPSILRHPSMVALLRH